MKFNISRDWLLKHAAGDDRAEVTAGSLDVDAFLARAQAAQPSPEMPDELASLAFGKLVNLLRRKLRMTVEQLAADATVDLAELVEIEEDVHYRPEPRTVYQLARLFRLPNDRLLQLSGNVRMKSSQFQQFAVKFAARSRSVDRLSDEEHAALEEFVKHLTERSE